MWGPCGLVSMAHRCANHQGPQDEECGKTQDVKSAISGLAGSSVLSTNKVCDTSRAGGLCHGCLKFSSIHT